MESNIIGKISIASIGCNAKKVAALDKPTDGTAASLVLCNIFGIASGLKHGEDKRNNSIWTALTGDFGSVNVQDGKAYRSGKLFLPSGIQEVLEGPLSEAELHKDSEGKPDPLTVSLKFAFEISAVQAQNPIGYSYRAKVLVAPADNDPLVELAKQLGSGGIGFVSVPALPAAPVVDAPTPTTNPVPEPVRGGKKGH